MAKKVFCFLCSFLLIITAVVVPFTSSALEYVSVPFPNPTLFDGLPSCVFERNDGQYMMLIMYCPEVTIADYFNQDMSYVYQGMNVIWSVDNTNKVIKANVSYDSLHSSDVALNITPILYIWYENSANVRVYNLANFPAPTSGSKTIYSFGSSNTISNFYTYNSSSNITQSDALAPHSKQFIFSGDLNQQDLNTYLLSIDNSLRNVIGSINSTNNKLDGLLQQYIAMNNKLSSIENYVSIIADNLTGSHEVPETTTNATIDNFNQKENEIGDSHFSALDNFNVPEFGGGLGNIANALNFIGRSLEDLTGNSHDNISSSSIDKIGTILFIVLMVGLVSLILNMVHNKE